MRKFRPNTNLNSAQKQVLSEFWYELNAHLPDKLTADLFSRHMVNIRAKFNENAATYQATTVLGK